ncbi:MAG: alpha/beta fold hydrolase [Pirellulaceae bacterium]
MTTSPFDWYDRELRKYPVPYQARMVETEFGPTHVLISGDREADPLVLLHGRGDTALVWIKFIAQFSAHFRTYAIDLPGYPGKSVARRLASSGSGAADWLAQALSGLGVGAAHVVGASLGGWMALKFAVTYPGRVSRLALLVPMGIVRPQFRNFFPHVLPLLLQGRRGQESLKQAMAVKPIDQAALDLAAETARYQKWFTVVYPFVIPDDALRRLTMPVLMVVGATDFWCDPSALIARVRRTIPQARIEQLAECDHLILNDQPELTMQAILTFLEREEKGGSRFQAEPNAAADGGRDPGFSEFQGSQRGRRC